MYNGDSMSISIVFISSINLKKLNFSYEWSPYSHVYMMPSVRSFIQYKPLKKDGYPP